jgi:hypothetical protein
MIAHITENRQIDGRWFLTPQEYPLLQQYMAPVSLCKSCKQTYTQQAILFYDILVEDKVYTIPYDIAAILNKEVADPDQRGQLERWEAKRCHDITLKEGEHTDVVKQAKEFLGLDIRQHMNNIQVDGNRLRELKEREENAR